MEAPLVEIAIVVRLPIVGNVNVLSYAGNLNFTSVNLNFDNFNLYDYYELVPEQWESVAQYLTKGMRIDHTSMTGISILWIEMLM